MLKKTSFDRLSHCTTHQIFDIKQICFAGNLTDNINVLNFSSNSLENVGVHLVSVMDSASELVGKVIIPKEQRTPSFERSDSDDEFFDALASDMEETTPSDRQMQDIMEPNQHILKDETATEIIEDLIKPDGFRPAEDVRTVDEEKETLRNYQDSSDDDSAGTESGNEHSQIPSEQRRGHPNRTWGSGEPQDEAEIQEGLKAEQEEEKKAMQENDEEDGGLIIDEEAMRELEEQMTEEQKKAKREEAQTHKTRGNELFKSGEYADSVFAYSQALQLCPLCFKKDRSIMYANRAACKVKQEHLESAIADCTKALELNSVYLKVVLRRAQAYEFTDKLDDSLKDYQRALELDPGCYEARAACTRLPDQIQERNEKLKAEMMSKLKDLGNLCLRPFGLSTENFQLNQDPSTGSYSVNFNQNQRGNNGK